MLWSSRNLKPFVVAMGVRCESPPSSSCVHIYEPASLIHRYESQFPLFGCAWGVSQCLTDICSIPFILSSSYILLLVNLSSTATCYHNVYVPFLHAAGQLFTNNYSSLQFSRRLFGRFVLSGMGVLHSCRSYKWSCSISVANQCTIQRINQSSKLHHQPRYQQQPYQQ